MINNSPTCVCTNGYSGTYCTIAPGNYHILAFLNLFDCVSMTLFDVFKLQQQRPQQQPQLQRQRQQPSILALL